MKLVAAKCPNCKANIDVDKNSDKTVCEYCGSKIIVEDAIAIYKLEVSGEVEVSNLTNFDKLFKLANRAYGNKYYGEALEKYKRAIELNPDNPIIVLKIAFCECLIANFNNLNVMKLKNGLVDSYNLIKDEQDNKGLINSFIKQTMVVLDILKGNIEDFRKSKVDSIRDCELVTSKLNDCIDTYETCYSLVKEDNELLDIIYSKIIELIKSISAVKKYVIKGKYFNYKINSTLLNQLKDKEKKYVSEYNDRHVQNVNNNINSNNSLNKNDKQSTKIELILKNPSAVILILFVSFIFIGFLMIIVTAIFGKFAYEGTWTNGNEKIEIHDYNVTYFVDNEEKYSGKYERKYEKEAFIITFDNYAFKTRDEDNKIYFCQIKSKDDTKCLKYYENRDLEDIKLVNEEELD